MNAETLDMQFDEGTDVIDALDLSKAKRINVDFPTKMIDSLDREAGRLRRNPPIHHQSVAGRTP